MRIDPDFDYWRDLNPERSIWETRGARDPDSRSKALQKAHQILWSKRLPNGQLFELESAPGCQLIWRSYRFSSDSITNSYAADRRFHEIVSQEPKLAEQLFQAGSRISAFILFPANRVDGKNTINGARGLNLAIADRMDLTLECIRRHYVGEESPLSAVFTRYTEFFKSFVSFDQYVDFWLLNDLVNADQSVRFYLPFSGFHKSGRPQHALEYARLAKGSLEFLERRL